MKVADNENNTLYQNIFFNYDIEGGGLQKNKSRRVSKEPLKEFDPSTIDKSKVLSYLETAKTLIPEGYSY